MAVLETYRSAKEWLAARMSGIGGSDAAAVLGLNPYKSNIDLWEEKTGRREAEDISNKPQVKYGTEAERPLRDLFALDYPEYAVEHKPFSLYRSEKHPFMFVSLDGELTELETGRRGVLEIKTSNILSSMHREKWNDRVPDNYFVQCLHAMAVTEFEFCFLKAHLLTDYGGDKRINTRHYIIERTEVEVDIAYLIDKETDFWINNVLPEKRPNLILPTI